MQHHLRRFLRRPRDWHRWHHLPMLRSRAYRPEDEELKSMKQVSPRIDCNCAVSKAIASKRTLYAGWLMPMFTKSADIVDGGFEGEKPQSKTRQLMCSSVILLVSNQKKYSVKN